MSASVSNVSATGALAGKRALVTGGGSGIGLAVATRLAGDGAAVTICGRTEDRLAQAIDVIAAAGGPAPAYVVADIMVPEQIDAAVAAAAGDSGLSVCVANAGGSLHLGSIIESDVEAVRATFELNMVGTFNTFRAAGSSMRKTGGGSMVAVSSGAGRFPHRHLWAYGSSKAGVDMMVRYAAEELAEFGIRVNSVQPGIIDDELMEFITAGGPLMDDYLAETPISRAGTPAEVADLVRFLVGPESAWITGENIGVDGGHHLRRGANYQLLFG